MKKNHFEIVEALTGSAVVSLSFYLAWSAGVTEWIINPFTSIQLLKENLLIYIVASILFSMGAALIGRLCFNDSTKSSTLLLFVLIPPFAILTLFGVQLTSFMLAIGWVLFSILFCREIRTEVEAYKKPRIYNIASNSFKRTFLLFSIFVALSVYLFFISSPKTTEKIVANSILQATEFSGDLMKGVEETQKTMALQLVDSVEGAFILAASSYMSEGCREELRQIYPVVDNITKSVVINGMESSAMSKEEMTNMILSQMKNMEFYQQSIKLVPIMVAAFAFFVVEMIKSIVLAPLIGMFSLLFTRKRRKSNRSTRNPTKSREPSETEIYGAETYI